jgi:hypothetical protein
MIELARSTVVLALAWFAAINLAASVGAWLAGVALLKSRRRERTAWLLAVRLLPAVASTVFAAVVFVPSHLLLEPANAKESFGALVYTFAAAAFWLLARSAWRVVQVLRAGRMLTRRQDALPAMSLVGVWRTRILVGRAVRSELTLEELDVAMAHERAHRDAYDNLKRFLIACAPDFFRMTATARRLEEAWGAAVETLADARAVAGDERRAVHLASALIKVAKLTIESSARTGAVALSALHDPPLLETRVRRLVSGAAPSAGGPASRRVLFVAAGSAVALVAASAAVARALHEITEAIVHSTW